MVRFLSQKWKSRSDEFKLSFVCLVEIQEKMIDINIQNFDIYITEITFINGMAIQDNITISEMDSLSFDLGLN